MDRFTESVQSAPINLAQNAASDLETRVCSGVPVEPSKLPRPSRQGVGSARPGIETLAQQRESRSGWTDASEVCVAELQSDQGPLTSSAQRVPSPDGCGSTSKSPVQLVGRPRRRGGRRGGGVGKRFPVYKDATPYACDVCDKKFARNCDLTTHKRCHSGERPHACSLCDARFARSSHLTVHARSHTGERPFACPFCRSRFARNCDLTAHARSHTGERPHACDQCHSRFARSFHLTTHRRTHSGERPHACSLCDARFATRSNLNSHARCHTGERPHACSLCDARFARSCDLSRHARTHSVAAGGEKKTFPRRGSSLVKHERPHAGDKP